MITREFTTPTAALTRQEIRGVSVALRVFLLAAFAGLVVTAAFAKEPPTTAIVLFDAADGSASYVQMTGVMLNGKTELRVCDGVTKLDKHAYDFLPKVPLAGAASLERGADGILKLTGPSGTPSCVLPNGVKFQSGAEMSLSAAADQAVLQGTVVDPVPAEIPQLKPGVKLVFVAAPDADLAQYLRAQRASSVKGWQDFLQHNPNSAHVAAARKALAALFEANAESAFADYQKTTARTPDLAKLKQAEQQAEQANKVLEGYTPAHKLMDKVAKEIDFLLDADRTRLRDYRKALGDHTTGYEQLAAARQHVDQVADINPRYGPATRLQSEIAGEQRKFDSALDSAEARIAGKQYDEAIADLGAYRAFAGEVPRVDAVLDAAYTAHLNRGQELAEQKNWEQAVAEYQKALEIKPGSSDATELLKSAQTQLTDVRNRQAADQALQQSKAYLAANQVIEAYDVLADLPDAQRAFVGNDLNALKVDYAAAAFKRAQKLQEGHVPIRGRADAQAVGEAYGLLQRASDITGDPAMKLKRDLLSDKIGAYYFDLAKRYLDKPANSGIGLGWLYLMQAQRFNQSLDGAQDEMARFSAAYQMRARPAVGVIFRDQTSRRESNGFADQMGDAVANGLESSGMPVKVVRHPSETPGTLQPAFLLVGEILQHRVVKNANLETLPSKYRAGTHDVKNEAWVAANQQYQDAQVALMNAQQALMDAQAHHHKDVPAANDAVQAAQQKADDARKKLDSTEQTRSQPVIEPYNYTKKTIDLNAVVEITLRVNDSAGNVVESAVPVKQENHKTFIVLDNVKPEDTEGVKPQNTDPDENQFLTDLEVAERDSIIKTVHDQAAQLPGKILKEARRRAIQGDFDGAAEEYILYLNSIPDNATSERAEAAKFLHDRYDVTAVASAQ